MQQKEILEEKDISVQGKIIFVYNGERLNFTRIFVSSPRCSTAEVEGSFTTSSKG